jgi:hypothetical protein
VSRGWSEGLLKFQACIFRREMCFMWEFCRATLSDALVLGSNLWDAYVRGERRLCCLVLVVGCSLPRGCLGSLGR